MGEPLNEGPIDPELDYYSLDGTTAYDSDNPIYFDAPWQGHPMVNRAQAQDEDYAYVPSQYGYGLNAFVGDGRSQPFPYSPSGRFAETHCHNFIEQPPAPGLQLAGPPEAIYDLQDLARNGYRLQRTAPSQLLSGIHALETSLKSRLDELHLTAPSIEQLQDIAHSEECLDLVKERRVLDAVPSTASSLTGKTRSHDGLSEEQLASVLLIVSRQLGRPLQLGVCSPNWPSGSPSYNYVVEMTNRTMEPNAIIIWVVNEYVGEAHGDTEGVLLSGIAPDHPLQSAALSGQAPPSLGAAEVLQRPATTKRKKFGVRRKTAKNSGPQALPTAEDTSTIWQCTVDGCKRRNKPFKSQRDLNRHEATVHIGQSARRVGCSQAGCSKRFHWPKDMARHVRDVHTRDHPLRCLVKGCPQYMKAMRNFKRHYNSQHPRVALPTPSMVQEAVARTTQ